MCKRKMKDKKNVPTITEIYVKILDDVKMWTIPQGNKEKKNPDSKANTSEEQGYL